VAPAQRGEGERDRDIDHRRVEAVARGEALPARFHQPRHDLGPFAPDQVLGPGIDQPARDHRHRQQHRLAPQPQERERDDGGYCEEVAQEHAAQRGHVAHDLAQQGRPGQRQLLPASRQHQARVVEPGGVSAGEEPGDEGEAGPAREARDGRLAPVDRESARRRADGFGGQVMALAGGIVHARGTRGRPFPFPGA